MPVPSSDDDDSRSQAPAPRDIFATTQWGLVLKAASPDSGEALNALDELCRTYWQPLFVFIRGNGFAELDAEDLTQQFFHEVIRRRDFQGLDPSRGRFRAFLLAAVKHFLSNERVRSRAAKRGGGVTPLPLPDDSQQDLHFAHADVAGSPDRAFDRAWALELLRKVISQLGEESARRARSSLFEELKGTLTGEQVTLPYAEIAARHGLSEAAVKVQVHRLKLRYRELLRQEVGRTVEASADIDAEIRTLIEAIG